MVIGTPELLMILGIVILIFGASSIPKLARSIKEAGKAFKQERNAPETKPAETPQIKDA